ncbi:hypothetical protein H261_22808 [Paramagnetospirillum caucaseum]|uniref:GmrSD restriction endonucleases N-terminal domain-containing protein n=1 Tax=Paramagnetospirillum caucaseum TaxID=1244869 RepID=M3A537_9PROT|nr:DUF262 domain-containing protein [Paramagnetospirillum caucaseum]EME67579.1 hypothetical protein H261_22808 [Paramagnetospirillum caucaseum]
MMSFERPITIKEAIDRIQEKRFLLPAIQREFVWSADQIELLFDSLMRGYPVGSFLFWKIDNDSQKQFQFYEFLRNYHERDQIHNPKADTKGVGDITAILDGQQRLTSLLIGLKGTYAYKLPRKRWNNDAAFPTRRLFLNLLSQADNSDREYDFRFLTKEEASDGDEKTHWFPVGDVLDFSEPHKVNEYLIKHDLLSKPKDAAIFANKALFNLQKLVHDKEIINYFLERGESLDKVLNIFIRVNSGGTKLSYSDLLLSIATAQWSKRDAREELNDFVTEINRSGGVFNFDKDFVLKSCLVVCGFKDIAFKVDNFKDENMKKIEKDWDNITASIRTTVNLAESFGYDRETLTSSNALIPVAYYLHQNGTPKNFVESGKFSEARAKIRKWLSITLLKRTFGGQPDNVLRPVRQVLQKHVGEHFPLSEIAKELKSTTRPIAFDEGEVSDLLYNEYGWSYTFSVLALLYKHLDFRNKFHQDHIFPKKLFTEARLKRRGIKSDKIDFFLEHYNRIGNLQLIEGLPNQEKSAKEFDVWFGETFKSKADKAAYRERHYIPDVEFSLENFQTFIEKREVILAEQLSKELLIERKP